MVSEMDPLALLFLCPRVSSKSGGGGGPFRLSALSKGPAFKSWEARLPATAKVSQKEGLFQDTPQGIRKNCSNIIVQRL